MNTPNRKNRRLLAVLPAGACAAAMLLAGLGSTAAFAANAGTITLTAPAGETLANHSFSAYKIGDYSGYADANANGKIDGTNVTNAAGAQAWLKAALTKAGLGVDSAKGLDEAGTLAATTQAAKLSTVANALADAANKPGAVVADKTSNTGSLTLNVPGEGLYLVVDSDGLPIIVGTKINGKDLEKQALGTAVIKSTSISVDKEGSGDTTIGKTVSYTATFKIPQKNANPTKLSYTDQPTNLAIVRNSLKIKVDNQAAVAVPIVYSSTMNRVLAIRSAVSSDMVSVFASPSSMRVGTRTSSRSDIPSGMVPSGRHTTTSSPPPSSSVSLQMPVPSTDSRYSPSSGIPSRVNLHMRSPCPSIDPPIMPDARHIPSSCYFLSSVHESDTPSSPSGDDGPLPGCRPKMDSPSPNAPRDRSSPSNRSRSACSRSSRSQIS